MPELIWGGKYDAAGRRTAPLRVALPFQTVETVNESAQERQRTLDFFATERSADWRNRLVWGDKKYVLPALVAQLAGQVDLIYIDPPFATGQDFSLPIRLDQADFVKEPSMIEVKAYRDTWGKGLDSYLQWFYDMATAFHELLAETGNLFVHLDPGISHYVKALLDEVFGLDCFRNEIVWKRSHGHNSGNKLGPSHDVLLFYGRTSAAKWRPVHQTYDPAYIDKHYRRR